MKQTNPRTENNFETEERFQAATIMMISQEFPRLRGKVWHIPNESSLVRDSKETDEQYKQRTLRQGNKNKALGMLAGVHDIHIIHNGILYKCELKQPNGRVSPAQKTLHALWREDCPEIPTVICYTLQQVFDYCAWILKMNYKIKFNGI